MNRRVGLLRWMVRQVFRERLFSVPGEASTLLWFRPSEYPSLLLGTRRVEAQISREWSALLVPGDAIFDVGANIGFTVQRFYALLRGQCRIWAFEPLPRNLTLLERNVEQLRGAVTVIKCALGDRDGMAVFNDNLRHGGLSRLNGLDAINPEDIGFWHDVRNLEVPLVTLDSFIASSTEVRPTFVKLDVEGAGHWVLKGGGQMLERYRPVISCSFHSEEERRGITAILAQHGYRGVAHDKRGECAWCSLDDSTGTFVHPSDARANSFVSELDRSAN